MASLRWAVQDCGFGRGEVRVFTLGDVSDLRTAASSRRGWRVRGRLGRVGLLWPTLVEDGHQ